MSTALRVATPVVRPVLLALLLPAAMVSGRPLHGQEHAAATGVEVRAPVATRRLARGTVLQASDFTIAPVTARLDARGNVRPDTDAVAPGWIVRRVIQPGEVLRSPAVAPAPLVAAGQAVRFTYQQDGLALTLDGVAPVAGALGDTIPVRLGARRRVTGVVAGPAHVVATDLSRTP